MHSKFKRGSFYAIKDQRGAATLLVALVLLIAMTLGAFFVHRTLVADQEVAGGYYRSARAQMAAEAGLELMVAHLKDSSARKEFFNADSSPKAGFISLPVGDLLNGAGTVSVAVELQDITAEGKASSFVKINSRGCWQEQGSSISACNQCSASCPSFAVVSQVVAFRGALAGAPSAPITARQNIDLASAAIEVTNQDTATNGLTVHAGGTADPHKASGNLNTLPGTPPEATVAQKDTELFETNADDYFSDFFGLDKDAYKAEADLCIYCEGSADDPDLDGKQGVVIWVDGEFSLNANDVIGSAENPVVLVVNGPLKVSGTAIIYGVLYSASVEQTATGNFEIYGAAVAEYDFTAKGNVSAEYDMEVLDKLSGGIGSYHKIPGSWRDF